MFFRAFCAVDRPMPSVFNGQIPERVLAPFEALSQLLEHSGACAVALLPADLPLKEAAAEALALTPCARSRCRLSSPSLKDDALSTALASLQSFGAVQRFEIMGLRSPLLYLAQDEMGPVLGILTTKDEGGDEPPPLAAGLKVSLQGLSGCTTVISAGRQWTVGELKDAAALPRHQSRLLQGSASLRDEQLLGDLLPEAQEELLLRLLRLDPRWAEAMEEVKANALAWQSLPQDLKDDRDLTLAAVTQEPHLLGQSAFLADAELVLAAANKDSAVLQLASPELWEESFSLRAVACSARAALPFAQLSRQVAQAAVRQDPLSLGLLPPPLQEEVLEAALDAEPMALQFAPEALRDDAALLRRLVAKNGRALRFASARLRNSRDLVLLAIASHPAAVFSASEELLTDKEVLLAAMERDPKLVHQLAHYARRIA
ncbi:unnamed protein product [Effrenium voratum]|nr:unnamed protein product [Effrenium voratum]